MTDQSADIPLPPRIPPDAPTWFKIAQGEIGESEIAGPTNNARIVEYAHATGLAADDDETPWCGAFVAWCMKQAGIPYNEATAAAARSWLAWGTPIAQPWLGCVVIFWRGSPTASTGHVSFYAGPGDDPDHIKVLGGNQGNAVSIESFPLSRVLGYRWPAPTTGAST